MKNFEQIDENLKKINRKINKISKKCKIAPKKEQKYLDILKQSLPKARARKKWPHFSYQSLTCPCGCNKMEMDREFMENLESLRDLFNKPMEIISGYRCFQYDAEISTINEGIHTTGCAVDIKISGKKAYDLLFLAMGLGFTGITDIFIWIM